MNRQNRLLIVPAMTKTALALILLTLAAVPAFAQTSEFGVSYGGVNRRPTSADKVANVPETDFWQFDDSAKEAYVGVQLDPGTWFRVKVGEMNSTTVFITDAQAEHDKPGTGRTFSKGKVDHIDGVVDYRFSEAFGTTGLFGGIGLYRQHGGGLSETNVGASVGVNADFPLNPRYGIRLEATYHWANFDARTSYVTGTAGVRIRF